MRSTYYKNIASALLICYCVIFAHSLLPHTHFDKDHDEVQHHVHYHSGNRSLSFLSDFFEIFRHITHAQLGENHLNEFLTTPRLFSPSQHYDYSDDACINAATSIDFFPIHSFDIKGLQATSYAKMQVISDLYRRGPPNRI